jgi:hypothetical protein
MAVRSVTYNVFFKALDGSSKGVKLTTTGVPEKLTPEQLTAHLKREAKKNTFFDGIDEDDMKIGMLPETENAEGLRRIAAIQSAGAVAIKPTAPAAPTK